MTVMSSDAWEEIGSRERPKGFATNPYRHFKPPPRHQYEELHKIEERKAKNQSLLEKFKAIAESLIVLDACIQMKIQGFTYDYWPSTECYFCHATNKYGTGIEDLKILIKERWRRKG